MSFEVNVSRVEPVFQPVTISITLDDPVDVKAFKKMMGLDVSIPQMVRQALPTNGSGKLDFIMAKTLQAMGEAGV